MSGPIPLLGCTPRGVYPPPLDPRGPPPPPNLPTGFWTDPRLAILAGVPPPLGLAGLAWLSKNGDGCTGTSTTSMRCVCVGWGAGYRAGPLGTGGQWRWWRAVRHRKPDGSPNHFAWFTRRSFPPFRFPLHSCSLATVCGTRAALKGGKDFYSLKNCIPFGSKGRLRTNCDFYRVKHQNSRKTHF